jgi:translation initiation factor IF-3
MYKKFKALGQLGKYLYNQGKDYYKAGGKKTKDIMKESNVSKEVAKSDIKSEIKRKFIRGGKKPSDFYNKPKGR